MSPARSSGVHDLAISDLNESDRQSFERSSLAFLNSLSYCTKYEQRPAQRVQFAIDHDGQISRAMFYSEVRSMGVKSIQIAGFPEVAEAEVLELLRERRAALAVLHRMTGPNAEARGGPHTRSVEFTHDVVAELPGTAQDYLRSLGKQKRQQLPRYWRRLQRELESQVSMRFLSGPQIRLEDILTLVRFNQTRMETLGKSNEVEQEMQRQQRRWPLTQEFGLLALMEANGRILGGTFNYCYNSEAFLITIAHDPELERLNIGNVALWKTFEHLIERGFKRYHLFWGRKQYKNDFGGVDHAVTIDIVSPSAFMARAWSWNLMLRRQVPRALRYARSLLRRRPPTQGREGRSSVAAEADESESERR